jgi:hypothetical protein
MELQKMDNSDVSVSNINQKTYEAAELQIEIG